MVDLYDTTEDDLSDGEKRLSRNLSLKKANLKSMYLKLDKIDTSSFSSLSKIHSPHTMRESVAVRTPSMKMNRKLPERDNDTINLMVPRAKQFIKKNKKFLKIFQSVHRANECFTEVIGTVS